MTVLLVAGARPNFMKVAPLVRALDAASIENSLVHTGQHYDEELSDVFFEQLRLPEPDHHLGVGSGSHARQTADVMVALEPVLDAERPELVVVVGDVNSTVASALTAVKKGIPVAHVEAGLRSGDWEMPEEVNRVVTDRVSSLLFTTSRQADERLAAEGVPAERVHRVGNVMIDTLEAVLPRAREMEVPEKYGVAGEAYCLVTLHRPGNVDDPDRLAGIVAAVEKLASERTVILPMHPRTRNRMQRFGLEMEATRVVPPLGYLEMVGLMEEAALVLTDSGGIQEETTALGVPCLTLRDSTERPVTIEEGTNRLVADRSRDSILSAVAAALAEPKVGRRPELWDGAAAGRIVEVLQARSRQVYEINTMGTVL